MEIPDSEKRKMDILRVLKRTSDRRVFEALIDKEITPSQIKGELDLVRSEGKVSKEQIADALGVLEYLKMVGFKEGKWSAKEEAVKIHKQYYG